MVGSFLWNTIATLTKETMLYDAIMSAHSTIWQKFSFLVSSSHNFRLRRSLNIEYFQLLKTEKTNFLLIASQRIFWNQWEICFLNFEQLKIFNIQTLSYSKIDIWDVKDISFGLREYLVLESFLNCDVVYKNIFDLRLCLTPLWKYA